MAINIYSGGSNAGATGKRTPSNSSAAQRAEATTRAVGGDAVASDSGSTAVKATGTLGKIAGTVGKVANFLKFAPGPIGSIASLVGKVANKVAETNDPEWWNSIPGDGVSTNDPLQLIDQGTTNIEAVPEKKMGTVRPSFLEFSQFDRLRGGGYDIDSASVINPSNQMITQYLMPDVRKVINAVVLQDASSYRKVLMVNATLYALWRQLKKIDHFVKRGKTYLPNVNVEGFPIMQVGNASFLQSFITRLEEYLHSNVRLPHTLCEYLTWRFGRTYKTARSAKSAFVMYNVMALSSTITNIDNAISLLMTTISSDPTLQKANSDIYNAYKDHDQEVVVALEGEEIYDPKEFVLRTNLDIDDSSLYWDNNKVENNILMDSDLDNPTTFMASTVSCRVSVTQPPLFPVNHATGYAYFGESDEYESLNGAGVGICEITKNDGTYAEDDFINDAVAGKSFRHLSGGWFYLEIHAGALLVGNDAAMEEQINSGNYWACKSYEGFTAIITTLLFCKTMEFYNVGIYVPFGFYHVPASISGAVVDVHGLSFRDATSLAQDSAIVPDLIIVNEQVMAFANLVCDEHKNKTTYRQVERRVAKDVANMVEQIPMAQITAK
jgi:hypothetical protein